VKKKYNNMKGRNNGADLEYKALIDKDARENILNAEKTAINNNMLKVR
jgi:hypothetical protein